MSIFRSNSSEKKNKVLLVGNTGVGKTSLRNRYIKGSFRKTQLMSIGTEYANTEVIVDGDLIKLDIYDIAGQEGFQIQNRILQNIQGLMVIFDLTRHESFFAIRSWLDKIYAINKRSKAPVVLIGNKKDLDGRREIPAEDVEKLISSLNQDKSIGADHIDYIETSAKTGENTSEAFQLLGRHILNCYY